MAKAKTKTNEQAFKNLLKNAHPIAVALLRERLVTIMELTKKSVQENPEEWRNPIFHPNAYIQLADLVEEHLGFDK